MTRLVRTAAPFAAVILLVAACGGTPQASALTDPTAILTASASTTAAATSVHADVKADGNLSLDLTGTGNALPLSLAGTTANADVDIAGGDAHATFALPGVLGLRGELIAVDGTSYVKTSLTGPLYRSTSLGAGGAAAPSASPDTAKMLEALTTFLARPELAPTKGEDVACGNGTCYTVHIELTPEELAALGADAGSVALPSALPVPMPDLGDLGVDLTVHVDQATTQLAGLTAVISSGGPAASASPAAGATSLTVDVTFSKWNESVTVTAPPADQVQPAG
jgi:hypothetical protein